MPAPRLRIHAARSVAPAAPAQTSHTPHASPINGTARRINDPLVECIAHKYFFDRREFQQLHTEFGPPSPPPAAQNQPADFLFLTLQHPHSPDDVFDRLRWGGQVILVGKSRKAIQAAAQRYQTWRREQSDHAAWILETPLGRQRHFATGLLGWFSP